MQHIIEQFDDEIKRCRQVVDALADAVGWTSVTEDSARLAYVGVVGAWDRLVHDLVFEGMLALIQTSPKRPKRLASWEMPIGEILPLFDFYASLSKVLAESEDRLLAEGTNKHQILEDFFQNSKNLHSNSNIPPSHFLQSVVVRRHSFKTFQRSEKAADALKLLGVEGLWECVSNLWHENINASALSDQLDLLSVS